MKKILPALLLFTLGLTALPAHATTGSGSGSGATTDPCAEPEKKPGGE